MSMPLEAVAREAIALPRHQRLSLARLLIELDDPGSEADVEAAWEAEIQARLPQEVDSLDKSPLLDQVIKESLRLYPPIHIGNRMVTEDPIRQRTPIAFRKSTSDNVEVDPPEAEADHQRRTESRLRVQARALGFQLVPVAPAERSVS